MIPVNKHGGSRLNAGRKPKDPSGPVVRVTTWITAKQARHFAENPRLNRTAQIQAALDAWISGVEKSAIYVAIWKEEGEESYELRSDECKLKEHCGDGDWWFDNEIKMFYRYWSYHDEVNGNHLIHEEVEGTAEIVK